MLAANTPATTATKPSSAFHTMVKYSSLRPWSATSLRSKTAHWAPCRMGMRVGQELGLSEEQLQNLEVAACSTTSAKWAFPMRFCESPENWTQRNTR